MRSSPDLVGSVVGSGARISADFATRSARVMRTVRPTPAWPGTQPPNAEDTSGHSHKAYQAVPRTRLDLFLDLPLQMRTLH